MDTSSRSPMQTGPEAVNLFCAQCDSQLGTFENEWTRLTTSYIRPAHRGQHFGTDIAHKTQVVPSGASQHAVEGCTMASVFCRKCSVAVGQYCKAAATLAQKPLVNQYFYKLSKTYLKSSNTNRRIEPIFGFGGDLVRGSVRASIAPRQSLPTRPSLARWSQTPIRSEYTPLRSQQLSDLRPRSHESSILRNDSYDESEDSIELKIATQDERIKAQEEKIAGQDLKIQKQDAKIQTLSNQLEGVRGMFDDIQAAISDLRSPRQTDPLEISHGSVVLGNMRSMVRGTRNISTGSDLEATFRSENEALRAENEELRANLQVVSSTHSAQVTVHETSNTLGKRKRDRGVTRRIHPQPRSSPAGMNPQVTDQVRPSTQVLTPQSSSVSERSSQASYNGHVSTALPNPGPRSTPSYTIVGGATKAAAATLASLFEPTMNDKREQSQIVPFTVETPKPDVAIDDYVSPPEDEAMTTMEPGYIEFSDDEFGDMNNQTIDPVVIDDREAESSHAVHWDTSFADVGVGTRPTSSSVQSENAVMDEFQTIPEPSRKTRSNSRRDTESTLGHKARSLAPSLVPEPVTRRRTLPPKVELSGMDHVKVITPALHEQQNQAASDKKRVAKTPLQSTEKILHLELTELGLEEWIPCKNKNTNAEYKKIVTAARVRQREKNKLAKLASLGINLPTPAQREGVIGRPAGSVPAEEAPARATKAGQTQSEAPQVSSPALSTVVNEQSVRSTTNADATEDRIDTIARRKQRRAEIRRRDQLAKEALEMDD